VEPGMILAGGSCGENDCPTIISAGNGMVDVQGYRQDGVSTPDGEIVVRVPAELILAAAKALAQA
jgi:hypothetical protein